MKYLPYFLLIFSFPFGVLSRFSVTSSVHIYLHDVCIALIILIFLKEIIKCLSKTKNILLYSFAGLSIVSLVGILTHVDTAYEFIASFLYMVRLAAYVIIAFPLFTAPHKVLYRLKMSMLVSGFIFVLFGYIQYVFYPNLRNLYYLGWDEHLYRLFSTLLDPNFSGIYILLIMLLFLSFMFQYFGRSKMLTRIFYVFGIVFLSTALLLTYSRSVYVTSLIVLITYLYMLGYKKLTGSVLVIFTLGIFLLPQGLGGEGVNLLRTASIFARFDANMQGLVIFLKSPIFGVGYNTLRFVKADYGYISLENVLVSNSAAGFPNSYIVLLATTGILGGSLAVLALLQVLRFVSSVRKNKAIAVFAACVLASFIAILISSLFENSLFYGPIIIWMVLLIGTLRGFINARI